MSFELLNKWKWHLFLRLYNAEILYLLEVYNETFLSEAFQFAKISFPHKLLLALQLMCKIICFRLGAMVTQHMCCRVGLYCC